MIEYLHSALDLIPSTAKKILSVLYLLMLTLLLYHFLFEIYLVSTMKYLIPTFSICFMSHYWPTSLLWAKERENSKSIQYQCSSLQELNSTHLIWIMPNCPKPRNSQLLAHSEWPWVSSATPDYWYNRTRPYTLYSHSHTDSHMREMQDEHPPQASERCLPYRGKQWA